MKRKLTALLLLAAIGGSLSCSDADIAQVQLRKRFYADGAGPIDGVQYLNSQQIHDAIRMCDRGYLLVAGIETFQETEDRLEVGPVYYLQWKEVDDWDEFRRATHADMRRFLREDVISNEQSLFTFATLTENQWRRHWTEVEGQVARREIHFAPHLLGY